MLEFWLDMHPKGTNSKDPDIISPEEQLLTGKASKIVLALDKTTKSQKFYLSNNPILTRHQNELIELFEDFFNSEKELNLKVTSDAFLFMGNPVYKNISRTENFAFKLFNDGVRSLTFHDGLAKDELVEFMTILNKGLEMKSGDTEDDLVTLLWEKQFDNIKYQVAESIIDTSLSDDGKPIDEKIDDAIGESKESFYGLGEEYKDIIEIEDAPLTFDATNFGEMFKSKGVLDKDEFDEIRREMDHIEKKENILADFMDIIPYIFKDDISEEEFKKTLDIIKNILDSCIFNGNLGIAANVLKKLKQFPSLINCEDLPLEKIIRNFTKNFSKKENIEELTNCLNLSFTDSAEEIVDYISEQHEASVPRLLTALPHITDSQYRKAICKGMAVIFKGDPGSLLSYINTKDHELLKDIIYLLSLLNNEKVVTLIPYFISHGDKNIKKESIGLLKNYKKNPKAIKIFLNALKDPDIEIRTSILRTLATTQNRDIGKHLLLRIADENFNQKELIEKKSYFFAISKIMQNEFIPHLSDILEKTTWFAKERREDLYQCASFALGIIGSDMAREVLEKGTTSKNKSVQKYCKSILRKIDMGTQ